MVRINVKNSIRNEWTLKLTCFLSVIYVFWGAAINLANAHYIQTHLQITSLSIRQLNDDISIHQSNEKIHQLLNHETSPGKTYFEYILDGNRDADLIFNGIHKIDSYCNDYNTVDRYSDSNTYYNVKYDYIYDYKTIGECGGVTYKDMANWFVGVHAYNPVTQKGLTSQQISDYMNRVTSNINDTQTRELLNALSGSTDGEKLNNLESILNISNAYAMAEEFYSRAKTAWQENRKIDAMYNLGIVIHLVQDMTVPTHVHVGEIVGFTDREFEEYVWEGLVNYTGTYPLISVDYSQHNIGDWIQSTAEKAYLLPLDLINENSAIASVKNGVESTSGLIVSFFKDVGYIVSSEDFYILSGTLNDLNNQAYRFYVSAYETTGANLGNYISTTSESYEMALFPGNYNVSLTAYYNSLSGGNFQIRPAIQNIEMAAYEILNLEVPLYNFYQITGRVVDSEETTIGIANVKVNAQGQYSPSTQFCNSSDTTDENGYYNLTLIPDTYNLSFIPLSGSGYIRETISDIAVSTNLPFNDVSLSSTILYKLSGNFTDGLNNLTGRIYANGVSNSSYNSVYTSNGSYEFELPSGDYTVYSRIYQTNTGGTTHITTPYQTVSIPDTDIYNIVTPAYQLFSLSGQVTDINAILQQNVSIQAFDTNGTCRGFASTNSEGRYFLSLISGEYSLRITAPSATYPPFLINRVVIASDNERNIRLSLDYSIVDKAINELPPGLEVAMDVFDIIDQAETLNYDISVQGAKELMQVVLNWGGSEMRVTVFRPDGSIYGAYQDTAPPISIGIPNPVDGVWRYEVEAIDVPYENYPFALVVGVTENQPPVANGGGPYSGSVGVEINFDASDSQDSDGEIVLYEWDWNDDGFYDVSTVESIIAHSWNTAFNGTVGLKVTDNGGLISTYTCTVDVSAQFDNCPNDPNKTEPGACGCGTADTDTDGDGTSDCDDNCANDGLKTEPGACGCGTADADTDGDGTSDCNDNCPDDGLKTEPGACGCGIVDKDTDGDGTSDCDDSCPNDPNKTEPGTCGCDIVDSDTDSDGTPDCNDKCPTDAGKIDPGVCGCSEVDTDSDGDGIPDCSQSASSSDEEVTSDNSDSSFCFISTSMEN